MRYKMPFARAVITTALFALAACGGHNDSALPVGGAFSSASIVHTTVKAAKTSTAQHIAVSSCTPCTTFMNGPSSEVFVNPRLATKRTVVNGIAAPWVGLLFDSSGDLFVANCTGCLTGQSGVNNVVELSPKSNTPRVTITSGVTFPYDLVTDAAGTLYVSNLGCYSVSSPCQVSEYGRGYTSGPPLRALSVQYPLGMAIDSHQNLYVANCMLCATGAQGADQILVYAPGATTPSRTITAGLNEPVTLAIDSADDLYVANCLNCGLGAGAYVSGTDTVTEYPLGGSTPVKTITFSSTDVPFSMATDASDDLFVGNFAVSTVTEYPPNATTPSVTIGNGVSYPASIGLDSTGALYVSNSGANTVTKYQPGYHGGQPKVTASIANPSSLAISP